MASCVLTSAAAALVLVVLAAAEGAPPLNGTVIHSVSHWLAHPTGTPPAAMHNVQGFASLHFQT
jgi:hypothetical protein